jgi:hypothetical protein
VLDDVAVGTELSKAIVIVSPDIDVSILDPPDIFKLSPKEIVVVDEVSSDKVIEEFVKDELSILDKVFEEPLIVLFVKV